MSKKKKTEDELLLVVRYATVYSPPHIHLCSYHYQVCSLFNRICCTSILTGSCNTTLHRLMSDIFLREVTTPSPRFICCWRYDLHCIMIWQSHEVTGFVKTAHTFFSCLMNESRKLFKYIYSVLWWDTISHLSFLSYNGDRTGSTGHGFPLSLISHYKVGVQCVALAMIGLKADIVTSMASSVLIVPLPWPGQVFM